MVAEGVETSGDLVALLVASILRGGAQAAAAWTNGVKANMSTATPMAIRPDSMPQTSWEVRPDRGHVLVVEDDPGLAELLRDALEEEGYAVTVRGDGHAALDALARRAEPPDVALLDLMLPGLNGAEVCRWLKTDPRTRRVPVILVTSVSPEFLAGWLPGCPYDSVIYKPFGLDGLLAAVERSCPGNDAGSAPLGA